MAPNEKRAQMGSLRLGVNFIETTNASDYLLLSDSISFSVFESPHFGVSVQSSRMLLCFSLASSLSF